MLSGSPTDINSTAAWAAGSPAHGLNGSGANAEPKGGNHVYGDGSGGWVNFDLMRELHSWSPRPPGERRA